jgi:hypothetical protein
MDEHRRRKYFGDDLATVPDGPPGGPEPLFQRQVFTVCFRSPHDMSRSMRPDCIGMYGSEETCADCDWQQECKKMDENIESSATRGGTHVRLTGKYKEKKYKPKTSR